ncbi:MAG: hypothetical protein IKM49_04310 [Ruminococcus sp.]|nr:hypothetical protein [Ruminococcus sp.]
MILSYGASILLLFLFVIISAFTGFSSSNSVWAIIWTILVFSPPVITAVRRMKNKNKENKTHCIIVLVLACIGLFALVINVALAIFGVEGFEITLY